MSIAGQCRLFHINEPPFGALASLEASARAALGNTPDHVTRWMKDVNVMFVEVKVRGKYKIQAKLADETARTLFRQFILKTYGNVVTFVQQRSRTTISVGEELLAFYGEGLGKESFSRPYYDVLWPRHRGSAVAAGEPAAAAASQKPDMSEPADEAHGSTSANWSTPPWPCPPASKKKRPPPERKLQLPALHVVGPRVRTPVTRRKDSLVRWRVTKQSGREFSSRGVGFSRGRLEREANPATAAHCSWAAVPDLVEWFREEECDLGASFDIGQNCYHSKFSHCVV
jgi:hypothetical protein